MARQNYQYEKRQRDLAKKKKKDEKRLKKAAKNADDAGAVPQQDADPSAPTG